MRYIRAWNKDSSVVTWLRVELSQLGRGRY